MSKLITVDELISQVRSQLDEENVDTIDDADDILPALNRAQDYATNILARHYEDPLLRLAPFPLVAGQREYDIPEDTFEDRIEKMEISVNQSQYRVERISYRDISEYESSLQNNIPRYYCIVGRKIRLLPTPSGTYSGRIWYLGTPEKLVKELGRITLVNEGSNYVVVDEINSALTTDTAGLASYVNLVDGQTGLIKASMQVKLIEAGSNRVTFKTIPTRTTVLNRTIETDLSTLPDLYSDDPNATVTVEQDDYLASIEGSSVVYFRNPVSNFLIQYSVAELRRKVGGAAELEERILEKFEKQVERSWVGREQSLRVSKKSRNWNGVSRRRWPYSQGN